MTVLNTVFSCIGSIGGIAGCVTGVVALFQTQQANKLAKDANTFAEEANDAAGKANELAAKANKISNDANAVSERALSVSSDQTEYSWVAYFNPGDSEIHVVNDNALDATNVTVVIRIEGEGEVARAFKESLPAYGELVLKSPRFVEKLREEARQRASFVYGSIYFEADVNIVWTSQLGVVRSKEAHQGFGKANEKKIL